MNQTEERENSSNPFYWVDGKKYFVEKRDSKLWFYLDKSIKLTENTKIEGLKNLQNIDILSLSKYQCKSKLTSKLKDLKNIKILFLDGRYIDEIKGLEYFPSIKRLRLEDNNIKKIEGLDKLVNLEYLNLSNNEITEIQGLENLKKLKFLDLSRNNIKSIKDLVGLKNLEVIHLSYNQISKIEGLKNLPSIKKIFLHTNQIEILEGVDKIPSLEKLNLLGNKISEVKPFKNLPNLRSLGLNGNKITRTDLFDGLPNIRALHLSGNEIKKIVPFGNPENFKNLHTLMIASNPISRFENMEALSNLVFLECQRIKFKDLTAFKGLAGLHKLGTGDGSIECSGSIQDKIKRYFDLEPNLIGEICINHQDIVKFAEYLEKYPSNGEKYKYIDWDKIPFDPEQYYQRIIDAVNIEKNLKSGKMSQTEFHSSYQRESIFVKNHPIRKFYFSFRGYRNGGRAYSDLTLNHLIEKIKKNKILADYEKNHYICLKNWQDIEKLIDNRKLDNDATRDFKKFIYKKFSVDFADPENSENKMKILL